MRSTRSVFRSRAPWALTCCVALAGCTAVADFPDYPLRVSSVAMGADFVCVVTTDFQGLCWGNGNNGQLGTDARFSSDHPLPVEQLGAVSQVVAGQYHACALDAGHAVWCWGDNDLHQVGTSVEGDLFEATPVYSLPDIARVYAGLYNTCASGFENQLYCWGSNRSLQLTRPVETGASSEPELIEVPGLQTTSLAVGEGHMCAFNGEGEVWCWGDNTLGQTGLGQDHIDEVPCYGDQRCIQLPHLVQTLGDVKQISSTTAHTCALKHDGTIQCWGENVFDQVGVNSNSNDVFLPAEAVEAPGVSAWEQVFTGVNHSCAIAVGGGLYCWGANESGQLGIDDDTVMKSTVPLPVVGLDNVKDAALGDRNTCAVVGDERSLFCWGNSQHGQISYAESFYFAPVQIGP